MDDFRKRRSKWAQYLEGQAKSEAERKAAEAGAAKAKAEREHLVGFARALTEADAIRQLVRSIAEAAEPGKKLSVWAERAVAVADNIDPRLLGRALIRRSPAVWSRSRSPGSQGVRWRNATLWRAQRAGLVG